ncbi:hypothetical protein [Vibrio spartinae]|uniref:Uncharacterized protein n=1 Tax=Vibrio spartinae TaxID=1918945 RepID=A0A1N6MB81_9VIBR|nr:hypothetical protein [Vibrio spartinae]QMV14617.1 hypothetical protein Vspart_01876 [Vibrio spartinae]SIO96718.1 hypothetical protein VSP9026_04524 [Vibrio spartinae]
MSDVYYIIAKLDKRALNETHSSNWPKLVAFSFDAQKILLEEGFGHGLMGGSFPLSSFNTAQWKDIFKETDSQWFSDYISNGMLASLKTEDDLIKLLESNNCSIVKITY